jgi:manganese oxidase
LISRVLFLALAVSTCGRCQDSRPIAVNTNHTPAGILKDGVLSVQLEIARGDWHPESDDGDALSVYAFGELGHSLQNPGPLIRVPRDTEVHVTLHNALPVHVTVHGLGASSEASLYLPPGESRQSIFQAASPGLYVYWGSTEVDDLKLRYGIDSELTGAFVVDPTGSRPNDEIFVMEMMSEHPGANARQTLATINGKSWPYTQRFEYKVKDVTRWRWINATNEPHALHLHGFYYRIDAFNRNGRVETYTGDSRPLVVTQRIAQGETFDMSWSPDRSGNWLFHCHMFQHMISPVVPHVTGLVIKPGKVQAADPMSMHDAPGMGQMVLGITVLKDVAATEDSVWQAKRRVTLDISDREQHPRYQLLVRDSESVTTASQSEPNLIGPPIVLARGQPVEIAIVNKTNTSTAIHWHGIELESYYDGVPGWTGSGTEITPAIAPGTTFIARMSPPRAGTFIYHTHWHDPSQLTNGLYGPLIVLPPGEKYDPQSDLTFVFSTGDFGALKEIALINGTPQSHTLHLQVGKRYRFRFINISTNNQAFQVSIRGAAGPMKWMKIAKDGIDLPDPENLGEAQQTITVGETFDVRFSSKTSGDLLLDLLQPGQKIHTVQTLMFSPP